MIVIVDSGGANLVSIINSFTRLGVEVLVSTSSNDIVSASHVVLPGVGSAQKIMSKLIALKLVDILRGLSKPVLGICVGMQILYEFSDEGCTSCLGVMDGSVQRLPKSPGLCVPHMGWNKLQHCALSPLMNDISTESYVYFVHSFAASVSQFTLAQTYYGLPFSSIVKRRNFVGMQFHPERSGRVGQQLLKNFLEL